MPEIGQSNEQIIVTARRAALCAGIDNELEVLVRVQAADAPQSAAVVRKPQAVALVIDRSGSMQGRPLHEARRCAEYLVSRMRPTDCVSLVQFDDQVRRLWPAVPVGDGRALRDAIASIHSGGLTNLHGGWLDGAQSLEDLTGTDVRRVILISDGCANRGVIDSAEIAAQCEAWAARGISTSTCGLGHSFNEELMVEMGRRGGGNQYYGEAAEDLMEPFEQELDLLANLSLREVTLRADAGPGVKLELVSTQRRAQDGWRMLDIAWGSEAWALFRVQVLAGSVPPAGGRLEVVRVGVNARRADGAPVTLGPVALELPVLSAEAWRAHPEDELVMRRSVEVAAAQVLDHVRRVADEGDWEQVARLVEKAAEQYQAHDWVRGILSAMQRVAASRSRDATKKEALYSSTKLSARLAAKRESASDTPMDEMPSFLRRKPQQGKGKP